MARRSPKQSSGRASSSKPRNGSPKRISKPELIIQTKISPRLSWMRPYLRKAKTKMPTLVLPNRIRSYKPSTTRIMRVMGNAYVEDKIVVIATHTQVTYINKSGALKIHRIVRLPRAKMLDTLAHEMAHLHYPKHGYEHEEFTRAIFKTFDLQEKCPKCKGIGKIPMEGSY